MLIEIVGREYVDLAQLDVTGLPIGSTLTNTEGVSYQLIESIAAIDHVNYETVKNCPSLRWHLYTGGGGGGNSSAPLSGDGSVETPFTATTTALQTALIPAITATVTGSAVQDVDIDLSTLG